MKEVVIVSAVRTPIGKYKGALSMIAAQELGALVISEALNQINCPKQLVDQVFMGCVLQSNLGQNPARQASLKAGLPISVPAVTINAVCGSGLESVWLGAQAIQCDEAEIVVCGGMENMSMAPFTLSKKDFDNRADETLFSDTMIHDALWDVYYDYHMGMTAENIADKFGLTRQMQDEFAALSQQKCEKAMKSNRYKSEIVPVIKNGEIILDHDEHPRSNVTADKIANLKPAFKQDGTVTAANSSGINDGAACVVLMSAQKAKELNIQPLATFVKGAMAGVEPSVMGLGAAKAAEAVLAKTNYTIEDCTLIEANEAFASQSLACAKMAGWDKIMDRVNVNGGAIALGHPVGASGTRILVTLLHELKKQETGLGLATLCIGGGMGIAVLVKR